MPGSLLEVGDADALHDNLIDVDRWDFEDSQGAALRWNLALSEAVGRNGLGLNLLQKCVLRSRGADRREDVDVAQEKNDEDTEPTDEDTGHPWPRQNRQRAPDGPEEGDRCFGYSGRIRRGGLVGAEPIVDGGGLRSGAREPRLGRSRWLLFG